LHFQPFLSKWSSKTPKMFVEKITKIRTKETTHLPGVRGYFVVPAPLAPSSEATQPPPLPILCPATTTANFIALESQTALSAFSSHLFCATFGFQIQTEGRGCFCNMFTDTYLRAHPSDHPVCSPAPAPCSMLEHRSCQLLLEERSEGVPAGANKTRDAAIKNQLNTEIAACDKKQKEQEHKNTPTMPAVV
jgi:hypothetical protein